MTITRDYFRDCKHLYDVVDMLGCTDIRMYKDPELDTGKERSDMVVGDYVGSNLTLGYDPEKDMLEYKITDLYISDISGGMFILSTPDSGIKVEYKNLEEVLDDIWCDEKGDGLSRRMTRYAVSTPKDLDIMLDVWNRRWSFDRESVDVLGYGKDWLGNTLIKGAYRIHLCSSHETFSIKVEDLVSQETKVTWDGTVDDFITLVNDHAKYGKLSGILSKTRDDIDEILGEE